MTQLRKGDEFATQNGRAVFYPAFDNLRYGLTSFDLHGRAGFSPTLTEAQVDALMRLQEAASAAAKALYARPARWRVIDSRTFATTSTTWLSIPTAKKDRHRVAEAARAILAEGDASLAEAYAEEVRS